MICGNSKPMIQLFHIPVTLQKYLEQIEIKNNVLSYILNLTVNTH